jgi:DNA-binding NarL/FixJ family response regulator
MIRIVVADDHPLVRTGLQQWLSAQPDLEVVGAASNGEEAIAVVLETLPDVVIMDVAMPLLDGIKATAAIMSQSTGVHVVVLSSYHDPAQVNAVLDAGAVGYFLKDVNPDVLVSGLHAVVQGGLALSPVVAAQLFARARSEPVNASSLTPREREILMLIAAGHGNKQIARLLGISDKTVKSHCGRLFQRIGVTDRTQAAIWALKNLPVELDEPHLESQRT